MTTITFIQSPAEILNAVGEVRAGGTDLQARRRTGVAGGPLVDINAVAGLDQIERDTNGIVRIGALVKIDTLARHATIRQHYPGLALAAAGLATPQIRLMGTVGGAPLRNGPTRTGVSRSSPRAARTSVSTSAEMVPKSHS